MVFVKILKYFFLAAGAAVLAVGVLLITCNAIVVQGAKGRIHTDVDEVPATDVALLLGTSPVSRITEKTNYFYEYRLDAAAALYKAGKVRRILISGSDNSHKGADETLCMQRDLETRGVPADVCILDGKGYRTETSMRRAYEVYGLRRMVVVSQHFHNERALYLADHLGLDFEQVEAYDAEAPQSALSYITYAREYLARVKMIFGFLGL